MTPRVALRSRSFAFHSQRVERNGASVINISAGGQPGCPTDDLCKGLYFSALENLQEAVNLAASYGIVVVASAGKRE